MYSQYKHIFVENPDSQPTLDEIRTIEDKLGTQLPADFVDFLNVANGSFIDNYFIEIPLSPKSRPVWFRRIFSTKQTSYSARFFSKLDNRVDTRTGFERYPQKVLPIADEGGSCLYLDLRDPDTSPVVAFIHGLPAWTGMHTEDTLIKVAENFSHYVEQLQFDTHLHKKFLQSAIKRNDLKTIYIHAQFLNFVYSEWREQFGIDESIIEIDLDKVKSSLPYINHDLEFAKNERLQEVWSRIDVSGYIDLDDQNFVF